MSFVNDSLKFQMAIIQVHCYFFVVVENNVRILCKGLSHLFNKNISVFAFAVEVLNNWAQSFVFCRKLFINLSRVALE